MERNRIELTGAVELFRKIPTRRGGIMAKWLLRVGDNRFGCVAFGNVADTVLQRGDGAEIGVTGTAAVNSWKTDDGNWRNDFQATAWAVEIDGETIAYEKGGQARKAAPGRKPDPGATSRGAGLSRGTVLRIIDTLDPLKSAPQAHPAISGHSYVSGYKE